MKIWHNPRCSKSRETLGLLEDNSADIEVIKYLETPPSVAEIKEVVKLLNGSVEDIIRKGEQLYKDNYKGKNISEEEWYTILAENPKLIERPIVIKQNKAVIGRPPENVLSLL